MMDALTRASHKLAEAIYAHASPKQQTAQTEKAGGTSEKVVDAEYEEADTARS
jgi:hypothetical protein